MLCYAMLCHAMPCHATLRYAMIRYAMRLPQSFFLGGGGCEYGRLLSRQLEAMVLCTRSLRRILGVCLSGPPCVVINTKRRVSTTHVTADTVDWWWCYERMFTAHTGYPAAAADVVGCCERHWTFAVLRLCYASSSEPRNRRCILPAAGRRWTVLTATLSLDIWHICCRALTALLSLGSKDTSY